jgi:hypothetical protein
MEGEEYREAKAALAPCQAKAEARPVGPGQLRPAAAPAASVAGRAGSAAGRAGSAAGPAPLRSASRVC